MPTIHKQNCKQCGKYYERPGAKFFCSLHCANINKDRGEKISKANKGRVSNRKGVKSSEETKRKLSESHIGIQALEKHPNWKGGKPTCKDCGKNLSQYLAKYCKSHARLGEKNHNWKGGITPINLKIRNSLEYKLWRQAVFERDNFTCIFCGERGGRLEADHIKPFALFPELRFAIDNGRTLCVSCHRTTDTWGFRVFIKK